MGIGHEQVFNKIVVFNPIPCLQPGTLARILITRAAPQTLYGDVAT